MNATTDTAIVEIKDQIETLANEGKHIVINDDNSFVVAGEFLKKLKATQKQLDDTRKGMTRPIDEAKKKIMDLFRPVEKKLEEVEASIKGSIVKYQQIVNERVARELDEQRKKADAELAERKKDVALFGGDQIDDMVIVAVEPPKMAPQVAGISTKTVWDFEITDQSKLPREMLTADLKRIRAAVDFGMREIPGVRVFQKQIVSARS